MTVSTTQAAQMAAELAKLMATTVAVETYSGENGYGPSYATSANVTCYVVPTRRLVRNADGEEELSEVTIHVPPASESKFTPGSRVTIGGRVSTVIAAGLKTYCGCGVNVEVACS